MREKLIAIEIADVPVAHWLAVVIIFLAIDLRNAISTVGGTHAKDTFVVNVWVVLPENYYLSES
jgi:hypothetical protein